MNFKYPSNRHVTTLIYQIIWINMTLSKNEKLYLSCLNISFNEIKKKVLFLYFSIWFLYSNIRLYMMSTNVLVTKKCRDFILLLIPLITIAAIVTYNINLNSDKNDNALYSLSNKAFAQPSLNKITITAKSAQFLPLTNFTYNQLKVIVNYQVNDISLVNTKLNGVMQIYFSNGTLIKTSSFPNGFVINKSGMVQFATSFADKSLLNLKYAVVLTDLVKSKPLSNIVTKTISFKSNQAYPN